MCRTCYENADSPKVVNDKTKAAAQLVNDLYDTEDGGVGGYGHIVFDDWNLDDGDIDFCLKAANNNEYSSHLCEETRRASIKALEAFKALTEDERYSALAISSNFI